MHVALYARVSTTRQADNDLSIPDQLRQLNEWCKANGHLVVHEYVEAGASATDDKRPIFQQLINDAMQKPQAFEAMTWICPDTGRPFGISRLVLRLRCARCAASSTPTPTC